MDKTLPATVAAFPVVAIGASAGGLDALRRLFAPLPVDTGMAFIVIQHLDPGRPSMLTSVLSGAIRMPVVEVAHGMRAEPNRVHVIPPGADLSIHKGFLALVPRQTRRLHLPIDSFFRALAEDQSDKAIGVVLSGSASDGTEGLRAIKAAGGITFAQDPGSAQFGSMPESAIAAGVVDFRDSPEGIAGELARLSHHPYMAGAGVFEAGADKPRPAEDGSVSVVLAALRRHAQLDFRGYKPPTVMRRIARRMALRRLGSASEYADSLRDDPHEAKALADDILIHVTSFFRDPAAFENLAQLVFPELLKHKDDDATIRVWVPGCSTGEEAYSLAICLLELLDAERREVSIKIFASDLSQRAIDTARAGVYAEGELDGVSPVRLARFFDLAEGRFRICKRVRDVCVFVRHDLTKDPPFPKLDLISCRNVLIYFGAELQRRVVPMLHHSLNKPGYLFLGRSEAIAGFDALFAPLDKKHRIYVKTGESPRIEYPLALSHEAESGLPRFQPAQRQHPARDAQRQADHFLLARYAPPGVVVNDRREVVQFRGNTGAFLAPPPGHPQLNVLKMARAGLVGDLGEALESARAQSATIRKQGVRITEGTQTRIIDLEVVPLPGYANSSESYFLVVFEEAAAPDAGERGPPEGQDAARGEPDGEVARLKAELMAARNALQAIMGEHQDTAEDLAAANEELVSANEELQSTNEELQSAQEELQSTNEELSTVNDEQRNRNQELDLIANDLANVLESVQIPVIIVDQDLRIRRFTPSARDISSLVSGDLGRSIDDVKLKVKVDDLAGRIRETIDTVTSKEWEVQGLDGRWFKLQIRPYQTADHRLDGAVLSFVDVDGLKRALQSAESARDYSRSIVETVPISLAVLDVNLRVLSANPAFHKNFATSPTEGAGFFELAGGTWDVPALRDAINVMLASRLPLRNFGVQLDFPGVGRKHLSVAGALINPGEGARVVLLAIEDVTERRLLEASEKQSRVDAQRANRAKDLFLATLSHELRTPLSAMLMSAQLLQQTTKDDPKAQRATAAIVRAAGNQARLIEDLLDISRIVSGKLVLDLHSVDLTTVVQNAVDVAHGLAEVKGLGLELTVRGAPGQVYGDSVRLQQVVANLLNNAIKFTPRGGAISVIIEALHGQAEITVTDNGIGIRAEMLPYLFDRFVQAEGSMTRAHGGLGLGLAIVRHLVYVHGGEVRAESKGEGQGATFRVTLPLATNAAAPIASARRAVAQSLNGIRVLLIEDDDDTREATASMIQALGAEVHAAGSAAEGLAAVEPFKPKVILCDIAMPGEDGYAFIRKLRNRRPDRGGATATAALTALAGDEYRRRALDAGFQMHLTKPIDSDRLAVAIRTLSVWPDPEPPPATT